MSVGSPQSNGQVERVNRELRAMLAKLTEPIEHSDWVHKISQVEFAMNNTVHCTTKQTPSRMLFGVEQKGDIIDKVTEHLLDRFERKEDLNQIREEAASAIEKSQSYNLKYFNDNHKPAKLYKEGDVVFIKNVDTTIGVNKKCVPKYRGPYIIQKQLGNDRYEIKDNNALCWRCWCQSIETLVGTKCYKN